MIRCRQFSNGIQLAGGEEGCFTLAVDINTTLGLPIFFSVPSFVRKVISLA